MTTGPIALTSPDTTVNVTFSNMGGPGSGTVELGTYTGTFITDSSFPIISQTILSSSGVEVTAPSLNTVTFQFFPYLSISRIQGSTVQTFQGFSAPVYVYFYVATSDL